jgi:hypothetical protein
LHLLAASVRHRSHASGHQAGHIVLLLVVFIVLISLEACGMVELLVGCVEWMGMAEI